MGRLKEREAGSVEWKKGFNSRFLLRISCSPLSASCFTLLISCFPLPASRFPLHLYFNTVQGSSQTAC
jgi:hypothetical protein